MQPCKRSATDAQFSASVTHRHKRPMYAQSLPSRRNTQGFYVEDAPEGESLLNRWIALIGDTFRAVKGSFSGAFLRKPTRDPEI